MSESPRNGGESAPRIFTTMYRPVRLVDKRNSDATALHHDVQDAYGKDLNAIIQVAECVAQDLELQVQRLGGEIRESRTASSDEAPASSLPRRDDDSTPSAALALDSTGTVQQATSSKVPLPFFHQAERSVAQSIAGIRHGKFNMQIFADVFSFDVNVGLVKSSFEDIIEVYSFFTIPDPQVLKVLEQEASTAASMNLAITNSLLALTVQFKVANQHIGELLPIAWARFKSTYARLPQLITQPPCISTCQELLYMVMFLQGFADVRTSYQLSSMAITVIRTIISSSHNISNLSVEDTLILWGVFSLHVEISLRCGIAPSIREIGFHVPPPSRDALVTCTNDFAPKGHADKVLARAELALIQSNIADLDTDVTPNSTSLEEDLDSWATRTFGSISLESEESLAFPSLNLRFVYYHSRFRLARISQRSPEAGIVFAQSTLRLLRHVPNQQYLTIWRVLIYPLWASLALLEDTLQAPNNPRACTNNELIQTFYNFLETTQRLQHCDLGAMVKGLSKIYALTTTALPGQQMAEENTATMSSSSNERPLQILQFLSQYKDFMPLAQGLMGNMPESSRVREFANLLGIDFQLTEDFGPFVPEILRPELYNFTFEYIH
ncbi:unnamed protein product [Clonostachys byssicola]|uniref:Transcription factor domain-containing protein n=1 Tax=Clonostachys byssicola TaxID=160290 RepID=A0A9N9UEK9_9HYPO|nr:unnamed protein product [Clonostachys byssicola]